ncbi:aldose 1-epimerase family protein [Winogradskyella sp. PG-2]|uniref:aldose 1-epimerase family protein n=1 Tax=Winogradskyella sp. PG-2 TaxID=754409 RepID=UPI0004587708|nr:aldose 1-epimerase family protein [Winogradskyella sp. PG-2]BAO77653.1 aldose epimerase family protein [Winogradskyella sp. PG-2]
MHILKNDSLEIKIKPRGAELSAINSIKNNKGFMWHADPDVWGGHAPNLFPVIGCMKDDSYTYDGKTYPMTKHGFVRRNDDFKVISKSETEIIFRISSNDDLYKMFPFQFELDIYYKLNDNILTINHMVRNIDTKTIYFSLGGHPAFTCPLYENESYEDYILEFEKAENSQSYLLNMENGLVTDKTKPAFTTDNTIQLRGDLFNEDALIFKDLKSRTVTLKHKTKGNILTVKFKDFPYLGIWAKPNAPYVCIEPWIGIADSETTNQKIEDKEGIIALDAASVFNASYSIEIDKRHLV